jgi:glyoxylase-like metal-dependent hydrolase (beta-lactamase superfamily II)
MIRATVIASGSMGNAVLVSSPTTSVLVDAGTSAKTIESSLQFLGTNPSELAGVLVTHEHGDHTRALKTLCRKYRIPVFANALTADSLKRSGMSAQWCIFLTNCAFSLGDLTVTAFPVPHDAADPVGFVINHGESSFAVATDLGYVSRQIISNLSGVGALLLESNHDRSMLEADPKRPPSVKARILSRHGHLSNEAAAELVAAITSPTLRHVVLAHLSEDCNSRALALKVMAERLKALGNHFTQVHCPDGFQDGFPFSLEI